MNEEYLSTAAPYGAIGLFGDPLRRGAPIYYIYSDEAGISENEPVSVVSAVVMHADRDWNRARDALNEAIAKHVPLALQQNFAFHAKDVRSGYREYDSAWSTSQRFEFIASVAAIPRLLGFAVCVGMVRRESAIPLENVEMSPAELHHAMAFFCCMRRANKYISDWAEPFENATLVSEDVGRKRKLLKRVLKFAREEQAHLYMNPPRATKAEIASGKISQVASGQVDRIIDTVHFVEKDEAPLLQLADACAFSFRRYFAQQSHGEDLLISMIGHSLVIDDWKGPMSEATFSFNPLHRYRKA